MDIPNYRNRVVYDQGITFQVQNIYDWIYYKLNSYLFQHAFSLVDNFHLFQIYFIIFQ